MQLLYDFENKTLFGHWNGAIIHQTILKLCISKEKSMSVFYFAVAVAVVVCVCMCNEP